MPTRIITHVHALPGKSPNGRRRYIVYSGEVRIATIEMNHYAFIVRQGNLTPHEVNQVDNLLHTYA